MKTKLEIALEAELERAKATIQSLTEIISHHLSVPSDGEKQRKALQDRLNGLIEERDVMAARISAAEAKQAKLQKEVENIQALYLESLEQKERQIAQLEGRVNEALKEPTFKKIAVGEALNRNRLYATANKGQEMAEEKQQQKESDNQPMI